MKSIIILFLLTLQLRVGRIEIKGNKHLKKDYIISLINLKKGDEFNLALYNIRKRKIIEAYQREGFFDAKIFEEKLERTNGFVNIYITIKEGPRYYLKNLVFQSDLDTLWLKKYFKLKLPLPYDEDILDTKEAKLVELLNNLGYPEVTIERKIERADTAVTLYYTIKAGKRVRVRDIRIVGNKHSRKKIIAREIKIKPGEYYNFKKIILSEKNIYRTGLYSSVNFKLDMVCDSEAVLVFIVTEKKPRYFRLKLGYHSPLDFMGGFTIGHRNLFDNAQKLELQWSFIREFTSPKKRDINISYNEPYFLGSPFTMKMHPFYERNYQDTLEFYGIEMVLSRDFTPYLNSSVALKWKKLSMSTQEKGITNSILYSLMMDKRNNIFYPSKGILLTLLLENAGGILKGNFDYRRGVISFTNFIPLTKGGYILAQRLKIGVISPYGKTLDTPLEEKFSLGGDGSLRGFSRDFIRTDQFLLYNMEIRKKVLRHAGFSIFIDNLWIGGKDYYVGGGIGIRFFSSFGTLRIDWGFNLRHLVAGEKGRLYINIGEMI